MTHNQLTSLLPGAVIPFGGDRFTMVDAELAKSFVAGDRLHVVQSTGALLHIPAEVQRVVTEGVDRAVAAAQQLRRATISQLRGFYGDFADRLESAWPQIREANRADVERARTRGRSTTRLEMSERTLGDMVSGVRTWSEYLEAADETDRAERRVDHGDWKVEVVSAPIGVVAFVFEGRPNVFSDAVGALATGNSAVMRIGGDALDTAHAIFEHALHPALQAAGLPGDAVVLLPLREHAAGWALFSDSRIGLAVARGSGAAVAQLSSVARQAGIPVSAHGTGGAWLVADRTADAERLRAVVKNSLDRKVCNTLNVAVVLRDRADELVPVVLAGADDAAAARSGRARVHVITGSEQSVPAEYAQRQIDVRRAGGDVREPQVSIDPLETLATEWEWEDTPELTVIVVDEVADAVELFNTYSPRFVASLISEDASARERFFADIDAPFVGDGFTRWVDGQYALQRPELGLSNWENGRLLGRSGILGGADLITQRLVAITPDADQHR